MDELDWVGLDELDWVGLDRVGDIAYLVGVPPMAHPCGVNGVGEPSARFR
jgi:hypothetical protein